MSPSLNRETNRLHSVLRFLHPLSAILFFALIIAVFPQHLFAKTITVPTDFDTIQKAINEAVSGDLILVKARDLPYIEQLILKAGITLEGEETARTIIGGSGSGTVITVGNNTTLRKLTIRGGLTGIAATNVANIVISNNIIVDNDTGINCTNAGVTITQNTIASNTLGGISCADTQSISITNNLITNNGSGITVNNIATATVGNNGFFANSSNGAEGDDPVKGGNPRYVNAAQNDYHFLSGSPYLGLDLLNPTDDLGAYGGSGADLRPLRITGLSITPGVDAFDLSWQPNLAYNITGYRIYFDKTKGAHLNPQQSGLCDSNPCRYTSTALDTTVTAPGAPTLLPARIGDQKLFLNWTSPANPANISNYKIYWGTVSSDYSAPGSPRVLGNQSAHTLLNLINDITYFVAIKAIIRPRFYISVTAIDNASSVNESRFFEERDVFLDTDTEAESPFSNEVQEFPGQVAPFPELPDEGGCFIATAAFGSPLAPHVQILRAFRDRYLLPTAWGRRFVALYYELGPPGAQYIQEHAALKSPVRLLLLPLIGLAYFLLQTTILQKVLVCLVLLAFSLLVIFMLRLRHRQARRAIP